MKKILFSTILALAATGTMTLTTSCEDQLDIEQKGVIPTENFYKTDADAEAALVAAYEGFMCNVMGRNHDGGGPSIYTPLKLIVNECGDDVLAAGANSGDNTFGIMLNQFYYDAEAEVPKYMYTGLYLSVYTCNLVLDHFADATTAVYISSNISMPQLLPLRFDQIACFVCRSVKLLACLPIRWMFCHSSIMFFLVLLDFRRTPACVCTSFHCSSLLHFSSSNNVIYGHIIYIRAFDCLS